MHNDSRSPIRSFCFFRPSVVLRVKSLYFCEPGTKTEDPETALALHTLTDLYLGQFVFAARESQPSAFNNKNQLTCGLC